MKQIDRFVDGRLEVAQRESRVRKAETGQFMTPASVAPFMAGIFPPSALPTCRLLDAGAGARALSCAFAPDSF